MSAKLGRNEMPVGLIRKDFKCHGPVATKDTEFDGCKMADMGCFQQEAKGEGGKTIDSNKFYHAAVVSSKGQWYLYVEYGRTKDGASNRPQYQFTPCGSEQAAITELAKQCKKKNTNRGEWKKVGSRQLFVPKKDSKGVLKDLYVVRELASRSVGLPDAKDIANEGAKGDSTSAKKVKISSGSSRKILDRQTKKLFKDLLGGAVSYTRSKMVGGTTPSQSALDDGRDLLQDALARIKKVGDDIAAQVNDSQVKQLTYSLYSMIPKVKRHGAPESEWILSKDSVRLWQDDIDAFETALKAGHIEEEEDDDGVMQGIPADVRWIDPSSKLGSWLMEWWMKSTRDRHSGMGKLKVHNVWEVDRHGDFDTLLKAQEKTIEDIPKKWNKERPLHQKKTRPDLSREGQNRYWDSNTALVYHGSRSINIAGIIREGFRFPKELIGVVLNGAAFGNGVYWADDWKKSAGYCSHHRAYYGGGGAVKGRHSFMFACDVIMGVPHIAERSYGYSKPPKGCHSVFGKAGHTTYLQNNEWIIYQKGKTNIRYLAEISW